MAEPGSARRFSALYSPCGLYRYQLTRGWSTSAEGDACILWIMLNPSRADQFGNNDPTIERCERRSRRWGFADMVVVNLFGYSASTPKMLREAADPVGPDNDRHVAQAAADAGLILCAWGTHGGWLGRDVAILRLLGDRPLHCLGRTASGAPRHPLYLPYSRDPTPFAITI